MLTPYLLCLERSYSPRVEFCGYSNPHPSENKIHLRIQMYGKLTFTNIDGFPRQRQKHHCKRLSTLAGVDEKKGSYVPISLPGCVELDDDFFLDSCTIVPTEPHRDSSHIESLQWWLSWEALPCLTQHSDFTLFLVLLVTDRPRFGSGRTP